MLSIDAPFGGASLACRAMVGRLMRENGICVKRTRKYKATTDSNHGFNVAPNLLNRNFSADRPNQKWAGDISYIWTLNMAIALRRSTGGCIQHSDRGSQYCSHDYQEILRQHGFRPSMSGKGNCYDNAAVETFFKTIKAELIWRKRWLSRRQAEVAI